MIDLSSLNENQREAVLWDKGPLLVLAGPGSGKTRVLTSRIARILEQSAGQHFRILALTFTNKAAAEMRGRVEELVPGELGRVRLTTFHSYAAELLQQHGNHLSFRPDFQILSNDIDREALLDDVLEQLRKNLTYSLPGHFKAAQLLPAVTRLLEHCIPPDQAEVLLQQANVENAIPLARVYTAYREALRRTNSLDFPSLIAESLDLLSKLPFLAKHIRKIFKHIFVDEFQDTNHSQYRILSLIAQPDPSTLFVVADDDQIIYQWNGASPKRIQALRDDFGVSELQLPENYRCPPLVIELANALIEKNLNRAAGKKPLKAVKQGESDDVVRVLRFDSVDEEAIWVARDISKKSLEERASCAVLARTKKLLDLAGRKLEEAGVPVYFAARKDEFKSAPLRMLHAILRLVNSKEDKQSLARLSKAFYELEGINIQMAPILSRASADGEDLLRSWLDEVKQRDTLEERTRRLLETDIRPLLNSLNYRGFADSLFGWAEVCQASSQPDESAFNEFEEEQEVWKILLADITKKFEGEDVSLHQMLHELDLTSKTPPKPPEAIPCFTIHASKGMEFGHVYLIGLVEDQLPSWAAVKKGDNSLEMQEERRNCFVAITRTQETLTMTFSAQVFGWNKQPSRFLREMGIEL
ncbi:DNA helicase-2/ATP-dependent DNA helicase PcrA [Plasticicumulans lactativorans]|uniref:DNA 3'-5' helicase n=1 Tax=Plasticicumulans lactativorans TaxID=1133106 RepID=A0A4R2LCM7_9GAMM|nr:ATP-dependent helicase [Plasticicumulans lactativorans]TCO83345.1 DNA helicase-2/ATP-dependent DNA helicase PcrA [Plasticicumulans lactativorans]